MNAIIASVFLAACVAVTVAAPGYGGPSYSQGQSYSAQSYVPAPAPVYGHQSYSYPSPAPPVRCGSNLLVGCAPHVATVGCGSYSPPSYGASGYGPAPAYGAAPSYGQAPVYRSY